MSNKLQIFNSDGTSFYDISLESYTYSHTTMSLDASIDGSFVSALDLRDKFKHTEFVLYKNVKYYLIADVTSTRDSAFSNKDKGLFRYTVKFNAPMIELQRMFMYDPQTGQRSYAFYGDVKRLTDDIAYNLVGNWRLVYQPNFTPSTEVPDEPISFDGATVADALNKLYSEKNVPFTVEGYTIYIGTPVTEVGHTFKYSKEGGLKTEPTTPKNNSICTQVYPIGSTQNIPYPYPKIYDSEGEYARVYKRRKADGSLTSVSVFKTHLMPSIYRETLQAHVDNGYDADNYPVVDYYTADDTYVNPFNPELPLPLEVTNEDIRPTIEGATYKGEPIDVLTGVSYYENDNDVINTETGEVEVSMFKITLPPMGFDVYAQAAVTGAMTIAMKSGDTIGASYKIQVSEEEFNKNFYKTYEDLETAIEAIDIQIQRKQEYLAIKEANNASLVSKIATAEAQLVTAKDNVSYYESQVEQIYTEIGIEGETPALQQRLYEALDDLKVATETAQSAELYVESLQSEYFTDQDIDDLNAEIDLLLTQKAQLEANKEVSDFPRGGAIFDPTNRDYELFPDSTNQSITLDVLKDIDTFGVLVPQEYRRPQAGDKFVLLDIEMPLSYIIQAESNLSEYSKEWMRDNNEYLREYPIKFDEALFYRNQTIANQITTNALIPYEIGGVLRKMPIQKITIKYYDEAIPTYDITLTDEIVVSQNAVASNTQKLQEQAYEIKQNEIKNADRVRHNSYLTQKTLDGLFDAEGGNRIDNIEANVGYFNGLFVGQNPNDFGLSDVSQTLGATSIQLSGGTLTHYWGDAPFENKVWAIAPSDIIQLEDTKQYYLYIQANRTNNSAIWVVSSEQKLYNEDGNVWFFNAGQIIHYGGFWNFVRTYGITTTIGATISSEIIKSHNFELTNDKFTGMMIDLMNSRIYMGDGAELVARSLTIRLPNGSDINVETELQNKQTHNILSDIRWDATEECYLANFEDSSALIEGQEYPIALWLDINTSADLIVTIVDSEGLVTTQIPYKQQGFYSGMWTASGDFGAEIKLSINVAGAESLRILDKAMMTLGGSEITYTQYINSPSSTDYLQTAIQKGESTFKGGLGLANIIGVFGIDATADDITLIKAFMSGLEGDNLAFGANTTNAYNICKAYIEWIDNGKTGVEPERPNFIVDDNGKVYANNADIRGEITADYINAKGSYKYTFIEVDLTETGGVFEVTKNCFVSVAVANAGVVLPSGTQYDGYSCIIHYKSGVFCSVKQEGADAPMGFITPLNGVASFLNIKGQWQYVYGDFVKTTTNPPPNFIEYVDGRIKQYGTSNTTDIQYFASPFPTKCEGIIVSTTNAGGVAHGFGEVVSRSTFRACTAVQGTLAPDKVHWMAWGY